MRTGLLVATGVVLLILGSVVCGSSGKTLKVLLVSEYSGGEAEGIKALLDEHGAEVTISQWGQSSAELAKGFDLVIVGGTGRRLDAAAAVLDYEGAVLGLGPYGCKYFGLMKLKNGHPYT